ncbi:uncharacterized protein CC84DRAFT_1180677 [Paraphaeosphaeria sporulosa]|uniref:Uncharacterized protein n=1 Tax=Paraphaeosphaeria sporulosa TaxID=1460663 RepID=A0A177C1J3_9PLEO|nr:uncharacterized protein CC84DRAFT_1180677 [Paraphaeosphaeria sporulosa]OAG00702.1 hypothetical protein CC84DRAFT_1180677 [Paraphaeosphaeria sporulosa]
MLGGCRCLLGGCAVPFVLGYLSSGDPDWQIVGYQSIPSLPRSRARRPRMCEAIPASYERRVEQGPAERIQDVYNWLCQVMPESDDANANGNNQVNDDREPNHSNTWNRSSTIQNGIRRIGGPEEVHEGNMVVSLPVRMQKGVFELHSGTTNREVAPS